MIRLAIIGNPLGHSLSPFMHGQILDGLRLEGEYKAYELEAHELRDKLAWLKQNQYAGFNVTVPYKEKIFSHLDVIHDEARRIAAVNTVHIDEGRFIGHNTDGTGFIRALNANGVQPSGMTVLLLGAGGAARAVASSLLDHGISELIIANRTLSRADKLRKELRLVRPQAKITALELSGDVFLQYARRSQLVVNSTAVGMWPNSDAPATFSFDAAALVVADLIYNPLATTFLKSAKACGARTVDGLDMFIYQGLAAQSIWLGREVMYERASLRKLLTDKLSHYE